MRLELTGRHLDITPAIRSLVDKKLARLERMLNDSAVSAQVVLTLEKRLSRADVTLHARGEKFLHGVGAAATWETSLTQAIAKIAQQAQRVKGKWQERKRRNGKVTPLAGGGPGSRIAGTSRASRSIVTLPTIVRAARQRIRALSVDEATQEAARTSSPGVPGVVVFREPGSSSVSVLFRSARGELTLVETTN
jgi:putative sigma-54 modulation protein